MHHTVNVLAFRVFSTVCMIYWHWPKLLYHFVNFGGPGTALPQPSKYLRSERSRPNSMALGTHIVLMVISTLNLTYINPQTCLTEPQTPSKGPRCQRMFPGSDVGSTEDPHVRARASEPSTTTMQYKAGRTTQNNPIRRLATIST